MHLCLFVSETLTPNVALWKPQETVWFGQPNRVLHTAVPVGCGTNSAENVNLSNLKHDHCFTDFAVFTALLSWELSKDSKVSNYWVITTVKTN